MWLSLSQDLRGRADNFNTPGHAKSNFALQFNDIPTVFAMILFETATSIWELMWEVALVYFIFRISFVYGTLTLMGCGTLIYLYNSASLEHHLPTLLLSPLLIVTITFISRFLLYYYEVPRVLRFRLAIGLGALILLILSYRLTYAIPLIEGFAYLPGYDRGVITLNEAITLSVFVFMPTLQMFCENASDCRERNVNNDRKDVNDKEQIKTGK